MGNTLVWLNGVFGSLEQSLTDFWNGLVLQEREHPIILALAFFIVLSFFLTLLCNCCCWCCGLCRPRVKQPGLIFVPANYGTMVYPPPAQGPYKGYPYHPGMQQQQEQPIPPGEPQPSTSKQSGPNAPLNV